MPTTDAQGRTISDDGNYWWDGNAWQLIQRPAGKNFLDTVANSVEGAVKSFEGTQNTSAPIVSIGPSNPTAAPAAAAPAAAAPAPAAAAAPAAATWPHP